MFGFSRGIPPGLGSAGNAAAQAQAQAQPTGYWSGLLKALTGIDEPDEHLAMHHVHHVQQVQVQQQVQQQQQQGLTSQYNNAGGGGGGGGASSLSYPAPPRPEVQDIKFSSGSFPATDRGNKLINKLFGALPIKLGMAVANARFEVTKNNTTGAWSNPRVVVEFTGGKTVDFPIDDEKSWPTDDVIARIALEAP